MDRVTADQMGMLATVMNSLALQDALESIGLHVRVMSAIRINEVCEDYIRRRAVRHLEKGRVTIFAAGTGNPFFTTDTAASAARDRDRRRSCLLKATKVDGVYDADPTANPGARRYDRLRYDQVLDDRLNVMDATAIVLCRDHDLPMRVFNLNEANALVRAARGEDVGTWSRTEAALRCWRPSCSRTSRRTPPSACGKCVHRLSQRTQAAANRSCEHQPARPHPRSSTTAMTCRCSRSPTLPWRMRARSRSSRGRSRWSR